MSQYTSIYARFAENNINVLNVAPVASPESLESLESSSESPVIVMMEFSMERHSDRKLIWSKVAFQGDTLLDALMEAEETIKAIRRG